MGPPSKRDGKKILVFLGLAKVIVLSVTYYVYRRNEELGERTIYSKDTIGLQYLWLGGDRLLVNTFRQGASNTTWFGETGVVRPGVSAIAPARGMSMGVGAPWDIDTGSAFPGTPTWKISPDGQHMLVGDVFGNIDVCDTSYVLGDTSRLSVSESVQSSYESIERFSTAWAENSQDCIRMVADDKQPTFRLRSKGFMRELKVKNPAQYSALLANLSVLGYLDQSTVLLFALDNSQNPADFKFHLLTMDVNTGVIDHDRVVTVPADIDSSIMGLAPFSTPFNAVLSPNKKQIAYLLPSSPKPMFPHSRIFARVTDDLTRWHVLPPPPDTAIWLSDIDGSHMRTINQWYRGDDMDYDLEWRPNGKALSWVRMKGVPATSAQTTVPQSLEEETEVQGDLLHGGVVTKVTLHGITTHNTYSIKMLPL